MSRFYLTTAIDYVNSAPHLGTAYEKVCADVIARYKRLAGFETRLLMGNDEHSQNVFKKAAEERLDPVAYCDRMEEQFRRAWGRLNVSFDDFIRTTQPRHRAGVTALTQRLYDAGDIYEGLYEGWYCVSCEEFKQEKDLVNGCCPLHPTIKPDWIREKNYFFRLSKYQRQLQDHFAAHPEFLEPDVRRNEILRLIDGGLIDISISRAGQAWGIPMPFDPKSVVYVWFDALINYASGVGFGTDDAMFQTWWPADLHVIGKDITRFHAVVWPAMLMAAKLPLPKQIFGHGFMTVGGQRMSKSLGTIIDPIVAADRLGADPLRLYLVKEIPFGGDGDFSWDRYDERYNVDLANNLGNLVSRVTAMVERYRQGRLSGTSVSERLTDVVTRSVQSYREAMDTLALDRGCQEAFAIIDATNEFIASSEPWALAKAGHDAALDQVLWSAAEALRVAVVLLAPVMPESAEKILERLGAPVTRVAELGLDRDAALTSTGTRQVTRADSLWPRLEKGTTPSTGSNKETAVSELPQNLPGTPAAPSAATPAIPTATGATDDGRLSIDEFMKIDLRVARVLAAERVPNSKKLMKLEIDLGTEKRQIVAGIAEAYEAEALVGRTVAIVANLKPAKLMGVESNGMILAASPDGGKPVLLAFDTPPPPGTRIR